MPTLRGRSTPVRLLLASALVLTSAGTLAGCGDDGEESAAPAATSSPPAPSADLPDVSGMPVPADLARVFTRLLERRAQALMGADLPAFESTLAPDRRFRAEQRRYFDNLRQLPLASLDFRLERASLVREKKDYWIVVDVGMEIAGFDAAPVRVLDRYRFSPMKGGRYRLSSVTDRRWERQNDAEGQPWDIEAIQVRTGSGVLAVLDDGTAADADRVVAAVERGIGDVRPRVPYTEWNGSLVVYALSDTRYLESLDDLTGDPTAVDGVTVSLPASPTDPQVVANRVVLAPRAVLDGGDTRLDRLVRHELTHVAVGVHDDGAPLWLTEGIAEWTSVQPLPPEDRTVDPAALKAARDRSLDRLPDVEDFESSDPDVAYALSWWVCEWIAKAYGEDGLWTTLDTLARDDVDPDEALEDLLQIGPDRLARNGANLLLRTYDPPEPSAPPSPSGSPSGAPTPSGSPTSG